MILYRFNLKENPRKKHLYSDAVMSEYLPCLHAGIFLLNTI